MGIQCGGIPGYIGWYTPWWVGIFSHPWVGSLLSPVGREPSLSLCASCPYIHLCASCPYIHLCASSPVHTPLCASSPVHTPLCASCPYIPHCASCPYIPHCASCQYPSHLCVMPVSVTPVRHAGKSLLAMLGREPPGHAGKRERGRMCTTVKEGECAQR